MSGLGIGYSCHDPFPSTTTNTQQIFWTTYEVARLGCRVDLVLPSAGPIDGVASHYGADPAAFPAALQIRALRQEVREPRREGPPDARESAGVRTTVRRAMFDWRAGTRMTGQGYDCVWTRDVLAAASCLRAGLPTVFETYRPDIALRPAFAIWRRQVIGHPRFLALIAHSSLAARAFIAAGVPADQCLVAHNGYAPSLMTSLDKLEARARLGLPLDEKLVVYAGHVGPRKGTDALVRLAAALKGARLVIVGVEDEEWEAPNVIAIPRVPVASVGTYLYAADALVIPPTAAPLARYGGTVLPMKLFSYLAAGRPIVAPNLPDIAEVVADDESAVLVPPDPAAAALALKTLLADESRMERLGHHAKVLSARYTWAERARKIVRFIETIGR